MTPDDSRDEIQTDDVPIADYNGAKNIGLQYARKRTHRLRSSPKSGGGAPRE